MARLRNIHAGIGRRLVLAAALSLVALGAAVGSAFAAPPLTLVRGFGGPDGFATVGGSIPGFHQAAAVNADAEGRLLVAGEQSGAGGAALVRFTPDGALDTSYGAGGSVFLPGVDGINAMALDSGGGAAVLSGRTTVTRVTAAGALDTAFGEGGSVSLPSLAPAFASLHFWSVAVLPDGDVLAAGIRFGSPRMEVVRLLPDGGLDPSFGRAGLATVGSGANPFAGALAMAVGPDGDIVLAGYAHHDPAVARLLPDGSLDRGFGSDGISAPRRFVGQLTALAVRPDGAVVAAGHGGLRGGAYEALLLRFTPSGTLDRSFGSASRRFHERGKVGEPLALLSAHGRYLMLIRSYGPALRAFDSDGREGAALDDVPGVPRARFAGTAVTLDRGDLILAWTPGLGAGEVRLERYRVGGG